MMNIGNYLFAIDDDFKCDEETQIIITSNGGAAFFFVYTLLVFAFSFMIWLVFYKIPDHYGLISKTKASDKLIVTSSSTYRKSSVDTEALVVRDFVSMSKDDDFIS